MAKKRSVSALLTAISCAAWLIIIIALMFTFLRGELKNESRYLAFYEEYRIEERTGLTPKGAAQALMALVDYMEGDRESIQLTVEEYGVPVEMYSEDEIHHMVDVYHLYQGFAKFQPAGIACAALILLIGRYAKKKGLPNIPLRSFFWGLGLFALLGGGLALWAAVDFTSFWTAFHLAFFSNDLWLMDPRVSRMIRICPESLFSGIAARMAAKTAAMLGVICIALVTYYRQTRKKGA
ncbi:MAG: DUF1461 domain-containing protein [Clostridia bacterium]|nr:DUF1461 domain-containing protein [Clostridia bacterium]